MAKKKKEIEIVETQSFVITYAKSGSLIINTKLFDWKVELAPHTTHCQIMDHYIKNNTLDEVNQILQMVYVTTTAMLTDMNLVQIFSNYFGAIQDTEAIEVSEESEKEDLKIVKQMTNEEKKDSKE